MKTTLLTAIILLCFVSLGYSQRDPNDIGIQDSLIVGETYVDSGTTFAFVRIYAVTDDSVAYYNLPLRWIAPGGGVYPGAGTLYFPPLTSWDLHYDTVMINEGYIRQFGFSDLGDDANPVLITNALRVNTWNVRFIISPSAPSQMVVLDTTYDPNNSSLIFGLNNGITEITPAFRPGILGIGTPVDRDVTGLPGVFALEQNYPNPFNPSTVIEFSIPDATPIRLIIYDILGNEIKTLLDESRAPGNYSVIWDGTDDNGNPQSSGTYFYRLSGAETTQSRRMTLIR